MVPRKKNHRTTTTAIPTPFASQTSMRRRMNANTPPRYYYYYTKGQLIVCSTMILIAFISFSLLSVSLLSSSSSTNDRGLRYYSNGYGKSHNNNKYASLDSTKILLEITTVGMAQFHLLEEVLDGVRDMCEAGAHISLHITTSDCDYAQDSNSCHSKNQALEDATQPNYPTSILSLFNEKLHCRNPHGQLQTTIHVRNPQWGYFMVGHHRKLFYQHLNQGYDVFIHVEEDELIRPTHVLAFLQESEIIRQKVGNERFPDYLVGFVRFENAVNLGEDQNDDKKNSQDEQPPPPQRVIWEFEWDEDHPKVNLVQDEGLDGQYFTTPLWHHQGMYMATEDHLRNWEHRSPDCDFQTVNFNDDDFSREKIGGGLNIFSRKHCNVTQVIPLNSAEDFLIHHLPDQNYDRGSQITLLSTLRYHKMRMSALQKQSTTGESNGHVPSYKGLQLLIDEEDSSLAQFNYSTKEYEEFVARGGTLLFLEDDTV